MDCHHEVADGDRGICCFYPLITNHYPLSIAGYPKVLALARQTASDLLEPQACQFGTEDAKASLKRLGEDP